MRCILSGIWCCSSAVNVYIRICRLMLISRNPEADRRPAFKEVSDSLSSDEAALLVWKEEDQNVSPQAAVLGAPLEEGMKLYPELQNTYQV